jgi:CRP-like cAMP-binding protein
MSIQSPAAHDLRASAVSVPQTNRLLGSLPEEDYRRLTPLLRHVSLRSKQVLSRQGQPIQDIIFPVGGVCSLLKTTEDGHTIEIIGIGAEGAIGASVALGQAESAADVVVQVSDDAALSLPLEAFMGELQRRGALFMSVAQYCRLFTMQLMQASACNALHSAEERCCRWLLTTQDRVRSNSFPMTQELLAMVLGVRRPTVTLIMAELHRAGLLHYGRGTMKVLDRSALLERVCECYPALSPGLE